MTEDTTTPQTMLTSAGTSATATPEAGATETPAAAPPVQETVLAGANPLASMIPQEVEGRDGLLSKFDSVAKLAEFAIKTERAFRADTRLPGEDASPEDWQKVWQKMGAPESPAGYEVPEVPDEALKSALDSIRDKIHTVGITAKQWEALTGGLTEWSSGHTAQMETEQKQELEAKMLAFKEENGDQHESIIANAQRGVAHVYGEGTEQAQEAALKYGNDPLFVKGMAKIYEAVADDSSPNALSGGSTMNSPTAMVERYRELGEELSKIGTTQPQRRQTIQAEMNSMIKRSVELGMPLDQLLKTR